LGRFGGEALTAEPVVADGGERSGVPGKRVVKDVFAVQGGMGPGSGNGGIDKLRCPCDFGVEIFGRADGMGVDSKGKCFGFGGDFECGIETVVDNLDFGGFKTELRCKRFGVRVEGGNLRAVGAIGVVHWLRWLMQEHTCH